MRGFTHKIIATDKNVGFYTHKIIAPDTALVFTHTKKTPTRLYDWSLFL